MKFFELEKSPYNIGYYMIRPIYEKLKIKKIGKGNYNILMARILGLSYPKYLRMCRDLYGATLIGKGHAVPIPYFKNKEKAQKLINLLNDLFEI